MSFRIWCKPVCQMLSKCRFEWGLCRKIRGSSFLPQWHWAHRWHTQNSHSIRPTRSRNSTDADTHAHKFEFLHLNMIMISKTNTIFIICIPTTTIIIIYNSDKLCKISVFKQSRSFWPTNWIRQWKTKSKVTYVVHHLHTCIHNRSGTTGIFSSLFSLLVIIDSVRIIDWPSFGFALFAWPWFVCCRVWAVPLPLPAHCCLIVTATHDKQKVYSVKPVFFFHFCKSNSQNSMAFVIWVPFLASIANSFWTSAAVSIIKPRRNW